MTRDAASDDAIAEGRFAFGKNWENYATNLDAERISFAKKNLANALGTSTLEGVDFLDIGCGSGLSSLAALELGAKVHAFDYDEDSVSATKYTITNYAKANADIKIEQASVLDEKYMSNLQDADVVYSWGVLHHTGDMWSAIELASGKVKPGGVFLIAIYNDQGGASRRWKKIKKAYVNGPKVVKYMLISMIGIYFEMRYAFARLANGKNPLPFKDWKNRKKDRGMSIWHDLVDWVGGYPFEVATPDKILEFLSQKGFVLEAMKTCGGGHGCNEFRFRKQH